MDLSGKVVLRNNLNGSNDVVWVSPDIWVSYAKHAGSSGRLDNPKDLLRDDRWKQGSSDNVKTDVTMYIYVRGTWEKKGGEEREAYVQLYYTKGSPTLEPAKWETVSTVGGGRSFFPLTEAHFEGSRFVAADQSHGEFQLTLPKSNVSHYCLIARVVDDPDEPRPTGGGSTNPYLKAHSNYAQLNIHLEKAEALAGLEKGRSYDIPLAISHRGPARTTVFAISYEGLPEGGELALESDETGPGSALSIERFKVVDRGRHQVLRELTMPDLSDRGPWEGAALLRFWPNGGTPEADFSITFFAYNLVGEDSPLYAGGLETEAAGFSGQGLEKAGKPLRAVSTGGYTLKGLA